MKDKFNTPVHQQINRRATINRRRDEVLPRYNNARYQHEREDCWLEFHGIRSDWDSITGHPTDRVRKMPRRIYALLAGEIRIIAQSF